MGLSELNSHVMVKLLVLATMLVVQAPNGQQLPSSKTLTKSEAANPRLGPEQGTVFHKANPETDPLQTDKKREKVETFKDWASLGQSIATILSFIVGGWWIYTKFVRAQEKYQNIEFSADVKIVGEQHGFFIAELIATLENKGKAQHRMKDLKFDLNALLAHDPVLPDPRWGGQVNFPHPVCQGSFLPQTWKYFFVDPGTKAKYSYLCQVPRETSFLLLHCWFEYTGRGDSRHAAEKTIKLS